MSVNSINGNSPNQAHKTQANIKPAVNNVTSVNKVAEKESKASRVSDDVTLTSSAVNLKKLEESIAKLPIVDTKKVEDVQRSIKEGTYQIDPDRIASKLIEMEFALFGK
ncbi:MAG: flagellar biosynthesis anti-sigma factor FlgM [Gammaproteobacteria bacterium]|nr:flagellar biosynthesis anti-sigma factor FlgM [Gammaproteobacteria bacterium]